MNTPSKKILVFTQMFPKFTDQALISGMIKNPFYQTMSLYRLGCDLNVITTGTAKDSYFIEGVKVFSIGDGILKGVLKSFIYELKMFIKFISLNKINEYDVIHVHHLTIPWLGIMNKLGLLKAQLVYTAHGTSTPELQAIKQGGRLFYLLLTVNGKVQHALDRFCWNRADLLLSPSLYQINEMRLLYSIHNKPIEVSYNGFDEKSFVHNKNLGIGVRSELGINCNDKVVIFVGRIARKKGIDLLINAMDAVSKSIKGAKLVIVMGNMGRQLDYRRQIKGMALSRDNVYVCENVPENELPNYYNAADICVTPSLGYESIPTVIYEAMACGLPVITQGSWGIPEVLSEVHLSEEEIMGSQLPEAIIKILGDEKAIKYYSQKNIQDVAPYAWSSGGKEFLNILYRYSHNKG